MSETVRRILTAGVAIGTLTLTGLSHAAVVSSFDDDNEGWITLVVSNDGSAILGGAPAVHVAAGGNPGGHLLALDPGDETAARFAAPAKFLGDQSAYLGGTLSFDLALSPEAPTPIAPVPALVVIMNETAGIALGFVGLASPPSSFAPYAIALSADGVAWRAFVPGNPGANVAATSAHFDAVFADITHLSITGEFLDSIDDAVSLDNVALTAVPLPGALPLLSLAVLVGGLWGRRRR